MDRLQKWLLQHGVSVDQRLALVRRSDSSAAVDALSDILPGTTLARIPKSACLSHRTSSLSLPPERLDELSPAIRLTLHVAHEIRLGTESLWAEYLSACPPASSIPAALLWDRDEDADALAWLRGTLVEREVRKLGYDKRWLELFHTRYAGDLYAAAGVSLPPLPVFLHACTLVASRAFQIDTYHGLALVPLADLFNHSDSPHVHLASDHWVCSVCGALDVCPHDSQPGDATEPLEDPPAKRQERAADTCDMVSERYVAARHEVFNTYGPLSNAQLLASYGFVLEANEFDCLLFDDSLVCEATGHDGSTQKGLRDRLLATEQWLRDARGVGMAAHFAAHPLITDARLSDALCIDADGRLDSRFFLLLVSLTRDLTVVDADDFGDLARASFGVARSLEQAVTGTEPLEADVGNIAQTDPTAGAIAARVAAAIVRLCNLHQNRQRSPDSSAANLLDTADQLATQASRPFRWPGVFRAWPR
ncbi:hypothetical protein JCM3774_000321 [Rhodotorula dairenensis]